MAWRCAVFNLSIEETSVRIQHVVLASVLSFALAAHAAPSKTGKTALLIARPVEASAMGAVANAWFSALTESYYRLRYQPLDEVEILPSDKLEKAITGFANYGRAVAQNDLLSAAKSMGASHILSHNYEVTPKDGSTYYYLEVVSVADNQVVATFEKNFPLGEFGKALDEAIAAVNPKMGIKPSGAAEKAMKSPIVSADPKNLQALGIAIFEAQDVEPAKAAQEFVKVTSRDPKMGLAHYEAAMRFAAIGDNAQAAQMLDNFSVQCNVAYASLYAMTSKYYRQNNSIERALYVLNKAEKEGLTTLGLALEKAQILEKSGKVAEAQAAYQKVLTIEPNQPDALILTARRDRLDKRYPEAIAKAEKLIKLGKFTNEALREKGLSLAAQKQFQQAEAVLLEAAKQSADDPDINLALGEIYSGAKKYVEAAQRYEKALKGMPNNLEVLLSIARAYSAAKRPQDALAVLIKNQQNFYASKEVVREMGLLEYEVKDTANARKHLEATITLSPPNGRSYLALGNIYAAFGDASRAIPMYEKAEELVEDKLEPQVALAKLHVQSKNLDKAMPYVNKVLSVKADYPGLGRVKGDVLFGRGDWQGALDAYLNERKLSGADAYLQKQISISYYNGNNPANAELGFKKLIEIDPKNAEGYYYLAVISLKLGKLPEVRTYLSQADILGKSDPALYASLAKAYTEKNQPDLAAEAYVSSLKGNPKNQDSWLGLAAVYEKAKKDSLAADAWYKAYQLAPDKNSAMLARAGHILYKANILKLARQYYTEFLSKKFADPTVNLNNGRMAYAEKNWNDVIAMLATMAEPAASETEVLRMLAEAYANTNKTTEALLTSEKLANKNPKDPAAVEMAALAYDKAGDLKKAASMYQRYLALPKSGKHQEYAYRVGQILEQAKQAPMAIEQYQKNTTEYPADWRNHERLGALLKEAGRYSDITKSLAGSSAKPDAPPTLSLLLAQAYVKVGQPQLAAPAYERYLAKSASDSAAWLELGTIYYSQKAFEKAISPLSKASVLMPKNTDVLLKLGMSFFQTKRLLEAADPLGRALAAGSKDAAVLQALSDCYRSLKDTSNLVEVLQLRIINESSNYEIANELGSMLMARGELDKAISALEAAARVKPTEVGLHMQLAGLYAKKSDAKMQGLHINAAYSYAPNNAEVTFAKAQYHLLTGQPAEARTYLVKTIEIDGKNTRALSMYGSMLKGDKKYREAFEQYNAASKLEPNNVEFMLEMGQCAYLTGKNTVALKVVARALEIEPGNPKVLVWAGVFNLKEANDDKALEYLMQAQQLDKNCAMCDEYLGQIYLTKGNFSKAVDHLDAAAKRSAGNDNVLVKLARALSLSGQGERAIELCNKALAINAQNDEALYLLCAVSIERGQVGNAEATLMRSKGSRTSGWIYLAQGRIAEARGDLSSAMSSYKLAARVLPSNSDMQMGLGRVLLAQKKYDEAIEAFGVASGLEPNNPQVFVGMGQAYAGQKDFASAKEYFKEALRVAPGDEMAHYMIAQTAAKQGETMEAITAARQGIAQAPRSGKLNLLLGELLSGAKQWTEAIDALEKAARNEQGLAAQAYKLIGDIYYRQMVDNRNARKYYTKHLESGGNDPAVRQALTKLENQ